MIGFAAPRFGAFFVAFLRLTPGEMPGCAENVGFVMLLTSFCFSRGITVPPGFVRTYFKSSLEMIPKLRYH